MLLHEAHEWLGWPQPDHIFDPPGEGARVYAEYAKRKIEDALKRAFPGLIVKTGVLAANPHAKDSSAPLAVVCEFAQGAQEAVLNEAHRLAWNLSRTSLLITLEPHRIIAWSCHRDPTQPEDARQVCTLDTPSGYSDTGSEQQRSFRDLLHWVSLVTGNIHRQKKEHFPADGRADELLLKNLVDVRRKLLGMDLPRETCHDLLARVIFVQYLFDRKDSDGAAFFSPTLLARLGETVFRKPHESLASVLRSHTDTYALFRWLDERFNGDLFPGEDDAPEEVNEKAWQEERKLVKPEHLKLLADLVSGTIETTDNQLLLWPQYSFDTIPLEFISSVYEEFLTEDRDKNKAYYTPPHLVDYVLDAVLPWDEDEWDVKIIDPSCGSGIFLVKAFQRVIYRWRRKHNREPLVSDIRPLLAKNFVGVDINPEAVRVACFSLYLAMADAIEPKHYVTREKVFPRLRGTKLIARDFFDETTKGFRTVADAGKYDLVVGNAPWGDGSIRDTSDVEDEVVNKQEIKKKKRKTKAETWAKAKEWPVANNDVGPLFICKGMELVKSEGRVVMVQPAGPWLYHRSQPALSLRAKFFQLFVVDEVTNLSAIRRELFSDVIGPACIMVVQKLEPDPQRTLYYFSPKPLKLGVPVKAFVIEPQDISVVSHEEAAFDKYVWSVLSLGGRRDLDLIRKLAQLPTLASLDAGGEVKTRMGVIPGDQKCELPQYSDRRYLDTPSFPDDVFIEIDARTVRKWGNPCVHSKDSTDFEAFKGPQLLIKQSYSVKAGRFRAAMVKPDDDEWGIICKETYLTVRDCASDSRNIKKACLVYNSKLALYVLTMTGSRLGHYITEMPSLELITVPLPRANVELDGIDSFAKIDEAVWKLFSLSKADTAIVDDVLQMALPDALRKKPGLGRRPTHEVTKGGKHEETYLHLYVETFCRVLRSTFGKDKNVSGTIYQQKTGKPLPVRMMTFHFDCAEKDKTEVENVEADGLLDLLARFHRDTLDKKTRSANGDGLGFQRVAFFLHSHQSHGSPSKCLTVIKPDERRYWAQSLAMRDADDLSAAILKAAGWKGS
jgi:hypothetical protein